MLHGFNNDVEYRGMEFHIQTEDLGESIGKIEAQIFHEGQILDTETVEYDSVIDGDPDSGEAKKKLKSLLQATHKGLYERLVSGEYDELVGLESLDEEAEEVPDPEEFEPSQERVPDAAMEVEQEGEEAFQEFHQSKAQKHVDLDDLKGHLEDVDSDVAGEESEPEVEAEAESKPEPESEPESEVDEALSGVGSELGGIAESPELGDLAASASSGAEDEESEQKAEGRDEAEVRETRSTLPPGELEAQEVKEVSIDEDVEKSGNVTRKNPDQSGGESEHGVDTGARLDALPVTGVSAYRGCEEPEGMLSIVPLVESFLNKRE